MIDNQHKKQTIKDACRTKLERVAKKPKRYIDEMWYNLFLTFARVIDKTKQYVNEIWYDLFEKKTNFCILERINI